MQQEPEFNDRQTHHFLAVIARNASPLAVTICGFPSDFAIVFVD